MRILILDYSTDRSEAALFRQWLPEGARVESLYIDTEQSFPGDLINRDFTHVIHLTTADVSFI